MKKKLALLMAAIMTVAMVPMTAFASTKLTAVDAPVVAEDAKFESRIELKKGNDQADVNPTVTYELDGEDENAFEVKLTLSNAKFTKTANDDDKYIIQEERNAEDIGIGSVVVKSDTTAIVTLDSDTFNQLDAKSEESENASAKLGKACVLVIPATAVESGKDVTATFSNGPTGFKAATEVIATVSGDKVKIESDGIATFVEDSVKVKKLKDINIETLVNDVIDNNNEITLKLSGNYTFMVEDAEANPLHLADANGDPIDYSDSFTVLNGAAGIDRVTVKDTKEISIKLQDADGERMSLTLSNIYLKAEKKCSAGDIAKITVSSKDFDSQKLEVAKMVEEAVTYTVEDDDLPTIWAGKDYGVVDANLDDTNTLKVSVEENTGDILNTSRKATFTFPDGIEVVGFKMKGAPVVAPNSSTIYKGDEVNRYEVDENVVTIWNYQKKADVDESDADKGKTDFDIEFVLNAAPTFSGDVKVTLGGEFDDVELKVATVKAPYTVEAKTTEVLIDYRYVPVNEIVITEAEEGILDDDDIIALAVEKMDFEDAGAYDVTEGDIDVDVEVYGDKIAYLTVTVKDASTEASTITISGLELYLDRTLPVGGYALQNVMPIAMDEDDVVAGNILWENSSPVKEDNDTYDHGYDENGIFKYKEVVCNDSYVEVVTQARDQDDSTTNRKIVITIGATTMAVGTETITLDTPAYINAENYTELPLRAVSEAFGATVNWDDASRTVTIMMGQRIVSMTIGSKTMYINGTPVAMNTAPEITNERTFVPVRDLANALGISKIDWNEASATVTLN